MHYITFHADLTSPECVRLVVDTVYESEAFGRLLTIKQLFFIFSGRITEWSRIGAPHTSDLNSRIHNSMEEISTLLMTNIEKALKQADPYTLKTFVDKNVFKNWP